MDESLAIDTVDFDGTDVVIADSGVTDDDAVAFAETVIQEKFVSVADGVVKLVVGGTGVVSFVTEVKW